VAATICGERVETGQWVELTTDSTVDPVVEGIFDTVAGSHLDPDTIYIHLEGGDRLVRLGTVTKVRVSSVEIGVVVDHSPDGVAFVARDSWIDWGSGARVLSGCLVRDAKTLLPWIRFELLPSVTGVKLMRYHGEMWALVEKGRCWVGNEPYPDNEHTVGRITP